MIGLQITALILAGFTLGVDVMWIINEVIEYKENK